MTLDLCMGWGLYNNMIQQLHVDLKVCVGVTFKLKEFYTF